MHDDFAAGGFGLAMAFDHPADGGGVDESQPGQINDDLMFFPAVSQDDFEGIFGGLVLEIAAGGFAFDCQACGAGFVCGNLGDFHGAGGFIQWGGAKGNFRI